MGFLAQARHIAQTLSWHLDYPLHQPDKVVVLLTHRCPLACIHCCTHDADQKNELPLDSWIKAVDSMGRMKVREVTFSGGEIMLRKDDVIALIERCTRHGIRTSIVTSGFNIDGATVDALYDAGLSVWMNSLDGPDAATHNLIRRRAKSFDEVMRSIVEIQRVRRKSRAHIRDGALRDSFNYGTVTTIMNQNCDRLTDIYRVAEPLGVDFIGYQAVTHDAMNKPNLVPPERIPLLQREVDQLIELKRGGARVGVTEQYLSLMPAYFTDPKSLLNDVSCYAGFRHFTLTATGHVNTCFGAILDPSAKGVLNLDIDVERLWRMDPMRDTRAKMRTCEDPCFLACWAGV
jgi:MoaA/NifB/PqqE/SkfB family radical SAM enzyme